MSQLLWWAIFLVPTAIAVVSVVWRSHPAPPGDTFHSVAAHHRFVDALSRTVARSEHPRDKNTEGGQA
ncbi:MAG TPA: hypothetical protein VFX70_21130 [Mycobacteriales bacterium]|nr:hypothetical protein [Mycobacteriales bacterium]